MPVVSGGAQGVDSIAHTTALADGGSTPQGTDCSGMVKTIYKNALDIDLPHNAYEIFKITIPIRKKDLLFGDFVFFNTIRNSKPVDHMGIYIDNDYFIHASNSKGVTLGKLSKNPYKNQYIGSGRIVIY